MRSEQNGTNITGGFAHRMAQRFTALFFILVLVFGSFQLTFSSFLVGRAEAAQEYRAN
jgi:hypothetical protein